MGRIDVLANNAGVVRVDSFLNVDEAHWDLIMDVNAKGVFFVMQAVARQMQAQGAGADGLHGRIINTASIAAKPGRPSDVRAIRRQQGGRMVDDAIGGSGARAEYHRELRLPGRRGHRNVGAD